MSGCGTSTGLSYIVLRLFAVIGILLTIERFSQYGYVAQIRGYEAENYFGLEPHSYKDGAKIKSIQNVTSAGAKSKAIVTASIKGDNTTWLQEFFQDWEKNVYMMDDPNAPMTVTKNKGNEASAYLTYIITHYHNLPDHVVFLHARRYQWHNEDPMYDHVPVLRNLRLQHVSEMGYVSLRCTWNPGCRVGLRPDFDTEDGIFGISSEYAKTFATLFPNRDVPQEVGSPCCAQFAVSREKIRQHPVTTYETLRQWIWDSDLPASRSGRILEYMWHIVFGKDAIDCPPAKECFCKKFGLCDLECDNDAGCRNRFWLPRWDQALPDGWPKEGQGKNGWPVDGWWESE